MRALTLLWLLLCLSCGTPIVPSTMPTLLWQTDAPGCSPRRPVVVPMGIPESMYVERDTLTVLYVRPSDLFSATFVRVSGNTFALCEWDTSDN